MLSVIMLSVIKLFVVMLSIMAPMVPHCKMFQWQDHGQTSAYRGKTWAKFSILGSGVLVYALQLHTKLNSLA